MAMVQVTSDLTFQIYQISRKTNTTFFIILLDVKLVKLPLPGINVDELEIICPGY